MSTAINMRSLVFLLLALLNVVNGIARFGHVSAGLCFRLSVVRSHHPRLALCSIGERRSL